MTRTPVFRRDAERDTPSSNDTFVVDSIGVLVYPSVSEQDSIAPVEIFKGAAMVLRGDVVPWPREVAPTSGRPIAQKGTKTPVAASVNTNGLPCSRTRRSIHLAHREDAWGHRELVQMQWAFASFASRFPAARQPI